MSIMALVAPRLIDLAIFGTLGTLWIGGCVFIFVLYRWIRGYERDQTPLGPDVAAAVAPDEGLAEKRPVVVHGAAARGASHGALAANAR